MDGRAALHMQQQQQQHSAAGCKLQSCVGYGRHGVELISDGSPPTSETNYCALGAGSPAGGPRVKSGRVTGCLCDATSDLQARCAVFSECARQHQNIAELTR